MEREELLDDERVLVGGALGVRRDPPVVEQLGAGGAVLARGVETDHGLGVADVDGEEHAAQTLPLRPARRAIFTSNYLTYSHRGRSMEP